MQFVLEGEGAIREDSLINRLPKKGLFYAHVKAKRRVPAPTLNRRRVASLKEQKIPAIHPNQNFLSTTPPTNRG